MPQPGCQSLSPQLRRLWGASRPQCRGTLRLGASIACLVCVGRQTVFCTFLSAVAFTAWPTPVGASMFVFIREGTENEVLAKLEFVGVDPFDHTEVASFQLTTEGAALGPLGLLGTDRIPGPFSSSVHRFTADGMGGLMSDVPFESATLTYLVNDVCQHELHVSAGPLGMSDALAMDPTVCASPSIFVPGRWRIVPECDIDGDGLCGIDDIDALIMGIAAMTNDPSFDLNGDGVVDLADRDEWLAEAGAVNLPSGNPYFVADFDLNSVVDGRDFNIWNDNKFSSTGQWSLGDANGDGVTDGQDFIEWNVNKFMSADGATAVPEPCAGVLLFAVMLCIGLLRGRR